MATKKAATRKLTSAKTAKKWSGKVTKHGNALDIERDVFKKKDPKKLPDH